MAKIWGGAGVGSWEEILLEQRYTGRAKPGLFGGTAARDGEVSEVLILLGRSSPPTSPLLWTPIW